MTFFLSLLANPLRAGFAASLAIILGLSVTIWGLPVIGGGLLARIEAKNKALERAASDLRQCAGSLESASLHIGRQNAAVEALRAEGEEMAKRQAKALSEAQAANSRTDEAIGRVKARPVTGCETGKEVLDAPL